jgi:hypothetical protein
MIAALGWLRDGSRHLSRKSATMHIAHKDKLHEKLATLLSLMNSSTDLIATVFQSGDPKWIDECAAIIR